MIIPKNISEKILIISEDLRGKGGVVSVVNNLAHHYEIFNHISSTSNQGSINKLLIFSQSIIKLLYFILSKKIRIVHIHGASYGSFVRKSIYICICKIFSVKVVLHIHSGEFPIFYEKYNYCNVIDFILNKVDLLIVLTDGWKSFYEKIIPPSKIIAINNLITPPHCYTQVPDEYPIKVLFLGTITNKKGIFDLISVVSQNKEYLTGKMILYIGGVGATENLMKIISDNKLEKIIQYKGWVKGKEKVELLQSSRIFILPSYYEGLPMSILEAMSYGNAIIATNIGGISEVVKDNYNGFLFKPGDRKCLKEALFTLINNFDLLNIMNKNSRKVAKDFLPETIIPQLEYIYKELLSSKL